jgi:hypothetical protein
VTLESIQRPLVARVLDLGDRALRSTGLRRNRITPEAAKADAARATGLDDFGADDFEEGLAVFCDSVEEDAKLDMVGREVVRAFLRRILSNRLLLIEYRKRGEETPELVPPVIVLGLPRTGTTYLHRLLAQDPVAHGPPAWQVWRPLPRLTGPDRRREITIRALEGLRQLSPSLDTKHYQDADEPEECYHLLDPSFRGPGLTMLCHARSFWEWVRQQDIRPAYEMYHEYLRIIQATAPGKRLTLKAPLHTPYMEEIAAEIPGVRFVQTHRDVAQVAASMASLAWSMFAVTSPRLDPKDLGVMIVDLLRWLAETSTAQRERSQLPVVDVQYRDLVADPVTTVHHIHEQHGLEWTPAIEQAVKDGVANRPQHKQGKHRYQLADFGVTEAALREALAPYINRVWPKN